MTRQRSNRQSRLILILGGAASGKSQAALKKAGRMGPKAFVATGQALDAEMTARIARHRATRSQDWHTAEVPRELEAWFRSDGKAYRTIVVDCLTLWLSNLCGSRIGKADVTGAVSELIKAIRTTSANVVLVSNELGFGLVPVSRSARAFRDVAGQVNQQIAEAADEVHLVISGQSLRLK
jgi:adenosylcobinamide kinase/adenosylcobinamide-phosphate guanylyltransferase